MGKNMQLNENLSEFNRRFADALLPSFPANVRALQSEDGTLLFRGPIPVADNPMHIGCHVSVSLDEEVKVALNQASPVDREEMIQNLLNNLGTQVRFQYDPTKIGRVALDVVGNMGIIRG